MQSDAPPGFAEMFGRPASVTTSAPGRVNLIGEHTDYNGGYVLPMASPQVTRVDLALRNDSQVVAHSLDIGESGDKATFQLGAEEARGSWIDYLQGVTSALESAHFNISGFDVRIESELPLGGGLSSSASLCVALLRALRQALSLRLDDVQIALLAQRAETDFVRAPVGVMDPMAASLGSSQAALFLDARTLAHELVPLPPGAAFLVLDSGISHDNARGEYGVRRRECERAAELLGVSQLRDLSPGDLPRAMGLPEPLGRRVRHVVMENERVLVAVDALRAADMDLLGRLFDASQTSMRDDYEISTLEMDVLVDLLRRQEGVRGARMTGGGFGGCVVAVCEPGSETKAGTLAAEAYGARTGRKARVLIPVPLPSPGG